MTDLVELHPRRIPRPTTVRVGGVELVDRVELHRALANLLRSPHERPDPGLDAVSEEELIAMMDQVLLATPDAIEAARWGGLPPYDDDVPDNVVFLRGTP